jgi:hypothetical protein
MCERRKVVPKELAALTAEELLPLYAECAKGIAKTTEVGIGQLRERLAEYLSDKSEGIT